MKRIQKTAACAAAVCFILLGITAGHSLYRVAKYQNTVRAFTVTEPDLSQIADGTYTGACDVDYVSARVAVDVKDGVIIRVRLLEHKNERGQPAETIPETIVAQQKIGVDTVAGATNSSKVIEKAVENALSGK